MSNTILNRRLFTFFITVVPLFACQSTMTAHSTSPIDQALLRETVHQYQHRLKQDPDNTSIHHNLGIALVRSRQYKKGIKHLEAGDPKDKNSFHKTFYLAEAYRGINKFAQAIFYYNKALTYESQDKDTLTALSWSYFRIRYYSEALATSHRILKIDKSHTEGSIILARTLIKLHQPKKAAIAIKAARKIAAPHMLPYLNSVMGDIQYAQRKFSKSIKSYRKALRKEPMLAGALFGLGKCLVQQGRPKAAVHYMSEALKIRPQYSEIHFQLGRILEHDDPKSSLSHYQAFQELSHTDPEHFPQVQEAQRKIQSLRNKVL